MASGKPLTHNHAHRALLTCKRANIWCNCLLKCTILMSVQWEKLLEVLNTRLSPRHLASQSTQASETPNRSWRASTSTTASLFQRENPYPFLRLAKIKWKTYLVGQQGRKWLWRRDGEYPCKPQGMQVRVPCYSSSQKLPIISRKKLRINFTLEFLTGFLLW